MSAHDVAGPVYGAGRAAFTTSGLSTIEVNMVQAALEEKARDEAAANDPAFAEFCASQAIDMADVSGLVAAVLTDNDESYWSAHKAAERIVGHWVTFRVNSMKQWERDEVQRKVLGEEQ